MKVRRFYLYEQNNVEAIRDQIDKVKDTISRHKADINKLLETIGRKENQIRGANDANQWSEINSLIAVRTAVETQNIARIHQQIHRQDQELVRLKKQLSDLDAQPSEEPDKE